MRDKGTEKHGKKERVFVKPALDLVCLLLKLFHKTPNCVSVYAYYLRVMIIKHYQWWIFFFFPLMEGCWGMRWDENEMVYMFFSCVIRVSRAVLCWVPIKSNSNCCAGFGNEVANIQIWPLKEDGIGMADFTRDIWTLFSNQWEGP